MALPLDVDGRVIGRLELMGADPAALDDENAQRVARSLAGVLALAQERERLAHAESRPRRCRSDALKTALLRAVSHELRTPLTAIKAAVGALARRSGAARRGGRARAARGRQHRDRRLDRLVSDLLDVSRLQAGSASTRSTGARSTICARRRRRRPLACAGRAVDVEADDGLPLVHCDASQIERVLVNLIENAAKFSPAGAPEPLRARPAADDHVEISVIDHGPGVELDQRERVFEPFYRGRGGGAGGTGLGLAIARGFVEANAGTLTIDDAPGGGTCMRVRAAQPEGHRGRSPA